MSTFQITGPRNTLCDILESSSIADNIKQAKTFVVSGANGNNYNRVEVRFHLKGENSVSSYRSLPLPNGLLPQSVTLSLFDHEGSLDDARVMSIVFREDVTTKKEVELTAKLAEAEQQNAQLSNDVAELKAQMLKLMSSISPAAPTSPAPSTASNSPKWNRTWSPQDLKQFCKDNGVKTSAKTQDGLIRVLKDSSFAEDNIPF